MRNCLVFFCFILRPFFHFFSCLYVHVVSYYTLAVGQDFGWSNAALQIPNAHLDEYRWCFHRVLIFKRFVPESGTIIPTPRLLLSAVFNGIWKGF